MNNNNLYKEMGDTEQKPESAKTGEFYLKVSTYVIFASLVCGLVLIFVGIGKIDYYTESSLFIPYIEKGTTLFVLGLLWRGFNHIVEAACIYIDKSEPGKRRV